MILLGLDYSYRATIAERLLAAALKPDEHVSVGGAARWPARRALRRGRSDALASRLGPLRGDGCRRPIIPVDAGANGPRNFARLGYPLGGIDAVFLTHFHSDHIDALGELATLRWATGDDLTPLTVYGPEGVDFGYRNDHHGDLVAPLSAAGLTAVPFTTPPDGELVTLLSEGGLTIEALRVDHAPVSPAVGYRFTYRGRTLLISGDTAQSDNITRFAEGIDLLVYEALSPEIIGMMEDTAKSLGNEIMAKVIFDVPDYHASPREAAETARDAGVGHLLDYHVVPLIIVPGQEALWLNGAGDIFPDYTVGYDGVSFSLPANSSGIIQTRKGM